MKIGMVKTRVLIKADEPEEKTEGGIYISHRNDISDDDRQIYSHTGMGEVIVTSSQVKSVEVGDRVFFGQHVGAPIELHGRQYLMMNEHDIQAVFEE